MGKKMKPLDDEIARLEAEIARLQNERSGLLRAKSLLMGDSEAPVAIGRKRSPNVKPVVLDIMASVGTEGATSAEVEALVRTKVPSVADATVPSVLSRLKSDGALAYVGERYYEKRFAPAVGTLRAVI
jgi:hypothetical protein